MPIYFRCPLHLALEVPFSSCLGIKRTTGDLGATSQPDDSCLGCWEEDPRKDTRAPCSWGCWGPDISPTWCPLAAYQQNKPGLPLTVLTAISVSSVHMLAQPPHLRWARDYLQAWTDAEKGSGPIYNGKIWGGEMTFPSEEGGWIPVLAHVPPFAATPQLSTMLSGLLHSTCSPIVTFFSWTKHCNDLQISKRCVWIL